MALSFELHSPNPDQSHSGLGLLAAEENVIVTPKEDRISSLYLTRFELAKVVGERAKQIGSNALLTPSFSSAAAFQSPDRLGRTSSGSSTAVGTPVAHQRGWNRADKSPIFNIVERSNNALARAVDPVMIAKYELIERRIRMILKRSFPDGRVEYIPVNELEVDPTMLDLKC